MHDNFAAVTLPVAIGPDLTKPGMVSGFGIQTKVDIS